MGAPWWRLWRSVAVVTARESRAALMLVTGEAVDTSLDLLSRVSGSPEARRAALLDSIPEVIGYFSEGSAALAVDFYEEARAAANPKRTFITEMVINDRTVKIRRAVAWAAEPLFVGDDAGERLREVVQLEVARPNRDTILANRRADPASVGWRRITAGGCKFCRMLADRGAVYKQATARFAAHTNCHCVAEPVFQGEAIGEEASVLQYTASKRSRTAAERAHLRDYLDTFY